MPENSGLCKGLGVAGLKAQCSDSVCSCWCLVENTGISYIGIIQGSYSLIPHSQPVSLQLRGLELKPQVPGFHGVPPAYHNKKARLAEGV